MKRILLNIFFFLFFKSSLIGIVHAHVFEEDMQKIILQSIDSAQHDIERAIQGAIKKNQSTATPVLSEDEVKALNQFLKENVNKYLADITYKDLCPVNQLSAVNLLERIKILEEQIILLNKEIELIKASRVSF